MPASGDPGSPARPAGALPRALAAWIRSAAAGLDRPVSALAATLDRWLAARRPPGPAGAAGIWVAVRPGPLIGSSAIAGAAWTLTAAMELCQAQSGRPLDWAEQPAGSYRAGSIRDGWWAITPAAIAGVPPASSAISIWKPSAAGTHRASVLPGGACQECGEAMTEIRWSETAGFRALVHDSEITALYASWGRPRPACLAGEADQHLEELLDDLRNGGGCQEDGAMDRCVESVTPVTVRPPAGGAAGST
jgi:hypothetical protein